MKKFFPGTKELGNPVGEDYYLFAKLTRIWHSTPLPVVNMLKYPSKGKLIRFDEFERKRLQKEKA